MSEDKRFKLAYEKDNWWAVRDGEITLWKEEVIHLLNELHKENQKLKDEKEIGFEFKKYSCEETGKKIEDYNTEKLLTSLLQNIINELQDGWFVAEFESDFNNEVDINTLEVFEKNISMDIKLRKHGKWLMIGQNKG